MLGAIALLLVCQLAGEAVHRFAGVPVPGSVIGLALLLVWLAMVRRERPSLETVTGWLTAHLAIMFVPAAVGLMNEGPVLARHGLAIVVATVISTLLTLAVTALVFQWAVRRMERKDREHDA
ncbi:CidA/LrgA family protein [Brevundimonas sp.]|uniref:CidA/LrgA family protein n=1 Tax=Brevundimonas sp. TaxID=1871086 RepID=UPI002FCBD3D5